MSHDLFCDLASAAHDGELDPASAADLAGHLDACADCARHAAALAALGTLVATLPRVGAPHALASSTVSRIRRGRRRGAPRRAASAAAVAVAAAVLVLLLPGGLVPPTPFAPTRFAPLPADAAAVSLIGVRSMYIERTVVEDPLGDAGRRHTAVERIWWLAPAWLRVERVVTDAAGRRTRELTIRRGDTRYDQRTGRAPTVTRRAAPDLDGIPEPLSSTVAVLGRPTGPGPAVAGRPTTRYELKVQLARRVALVDTARFVTLRGEDRLVLAKEHVENGVVVATRIVTRVDVNPPIDASRFDVPDDARAVDLGFRTRDPARLRGLVPDAAPDLSVVAAGTSADGADVVLYQSGAFPVLVTTAPPVVADDRADVEPVTVGTMPGLVRVPLYGYPSVSFTHDGARVTLVAPLPPAQLVDLAERMYFPAE